MENKTDLIFKSIVTAGILLCLILLVFSPNKETAPAQRPAGTGEKQGTKNSTSQAVEAYTASLQTVSNYIKVNGDMTAEAEINIYPDTSGKIISLNVSEGENVRSGQTVAVVDPSLPGQKYAPNNVYTTIAGTVLNINSHVGDKVSANTTILTVGDLSKLELITYVPEKFSGYVKTGLPGEVTFAAFGDQVFSAIIEEVGTVINPASRTIKITLKLKENSSEIKPGMFAAIKLVTEQVQNAVAVPTEAIFTYYGKDTAFIITPEGTAERRDVTVGLRSDELVELLSGIEAGDAVVTAGQSLLKEGSKVHGVE
jgi:membrane fusion protein, multidrug efflux system